MSDSAYDLRGTEKDEDLIWKPFLQNDGLVIIETLPPIRVDPQKVKRRNAELSADLPVQAAADPSETRSFEVKRNGGENRTRTAGMILTDWARQALERELYPGLLTNLNIVIPKLHPEQIVSQSDHEDAREHVTNAYDRIFQSGMDDEDVVVVFEVNGIPNGTGLGQLSTTTLLQVINKQNELFRLKQQGEFKASHVLPVFIVKATDPFSNSGDIVESMYRSLVNPDVKVARIDTRGFTAERLANFWSESGAFGDELITPDHPVVKEVVSVYGGNSSLAYQMRQIGHNLTHLAGTDLSARNDVLSHVYELAIHGGRFPISQDGQPPLPFPDR